MASYEEIYNYLRQDVPSNSLWRRSMVACWIAANKIRAEDPATSEHAARLVWAQSVEADPESAVRIMRGAILDNPDMLSKLEQAQDSDIQNVVDELVNRFAVKG